MIDAADADGVERRTMRKVTIRIVPFLMVAYFLAYLDRINIGFASLEMNKDLGLTSTAYGWAAGIFFIAYILFEIPSNLIMERVGARIWIARIMVSWGLVTAATAFVVGPTSLFIARFMLGFAEAGFFPGALLYLTYWCPSAYRAKVVAGFSISVPLSGFVGSPISGALLGLDGLWGLHGWQWLFIAEGLPAVVVGILVFAYLPSTPQKAEWLDCEERDWLVRTLEAEESSNASTRHSSLWRTLADGRVLALGLVSAASLGTGYGLSYWQPQMIKAFGLTNFQTGLLSAIPFGIAAVGMLVWAWNSDRTNERVWHTIIPLLTSAVGLGACLFFDQLGLILVALCFALTGGFGVKGPFWALVSCWVSPANKAAAIAAINSIANVSGFVAPFLVGYIKDRTGSFALGLLPMIAMAFLGIATIVLLERRGPRRPSFVGEPLPLPPTSTHLPAR
jgi:ACS family tartrate transporter-like MFS transporter